MQEVINFIKKNIDNDSKIVVATSGGPDSMCLLSLLCNLKKEKSLDIIVAHVNHKLRSESDKELLMVKQFCQNNNITFEYIELNEFKNIRFTEELARKKRYDFFNKLILKYNAKYLLTAHHGDDLVETILMRISRGSTLSGYAGIRELSKNDNYIILRPLLYVTKEEILNYLNNNNISYAIDKSNSNLKYTRNRYRHKILSSLKEENRNIHLKYLKFSKELQKYEEFVNNYIDNKKIIVDNSVIINKLNCENEFIKRKTIELLIKKIQTNDILEVNDKNMKDLLSLLNKKNKSINLNNNYIAINSYDVLKIVKNNNDTFNEIIIDKDISTKLFNFYYNSCDGDTTNNSIFLDSSELSLPLKLRSKQESDRMSIKNLNGSKKVKDIFIDSKIPLKKRNIYPILVDSENKILWIPGLKKSQFSKDKSEKYDIIIKCEAR